MRTMPLRIVLVGIAAMGLLLPMGAQESHWAAAGDATAQAIIEKERQWAESICANNGVVEGLLAEDFQGTSTDGTRFTKADELRDEKGPHAARDCGLDRTRVRFFGDSLAMVYGSEHAVGKDRAQPKAKVCQIWTDTWMKRGGRWQVIASQDNRVGCR